MNHVTPPSKRFRVIAAALVVGPLLLVLPNPPHRGTIPQFCAAESHGVLVASHCPDSSVWFASGRIRSAAGVPTCWWSADQLLFEQIPGVGPSLANRLIEYRDAGGRLDRDALESIRGVGPSLSEDAMAWLTNECAHSSLAHATRD